MLFAQSEKRAYRIGLLPELNASNRKDFVEALQRHGWTSNREFILVDPASSAITSRMVPSASARASEEIPSVTQQLLSKRPDVILATSTAYAMAVNRLSADVPVVMWTSGYPVEAGVAEKLARPGKNVTGNSIYAGTGMWSKLLELLSELSPAIKHVAVLWDYVPPNFVREEIAPAHQELTNAAHKLNLELRILEIGNRADAHAALAALSGQKADALVVTSGWGLLQMRQEVMRFATQRGMPVIADFRWPANIEPYPLLVYGASQAELMRTAADYTVRILGGANPANLPIYQPTKFDLIVNLKSAEMLGVRVPQVVRVRAQEVIE